MEVRVVGGEETDVWRWIGPKCDSSMSPASPLGVGSNDQSRGGGRTSPSLANTTMNQSQLSQSVTSPPHAALSANKKMAAPIYPKLPVYSEDEEQTDAGR